MVEYNSIVYIYRENLQDLPEKEKN